MKSSLRKSRHSTSTFLKRARRQSGLSQSEVARHLGLVGYQFISNFERGLCDVPLPMLKKLIKIYHLDASVVIKLWLSAERRRLESHLK